MRSDIFGKNLETTSRGGMTLQNSRMVKVALDGAVYARQGTMVAYQGQMDFEYQGSGPRRFFKKVVTGEGLPLMRVTGQGDLFLAHDAQEIHLIDLEGDSVTVNGPNVMAFESGLNWDIRRVAGMAGRTAAGWFNTVFTGHGRLAVTTHGTPAVLTVDAPTCVDIQSAIAWSSSLRASLHSSVKMGALVGRSSGEAWQISFSGQGFVMVQASEGITVPPHTHNTREQ